MGKGWPYRKPKSDHYAESSTAAAKNKKKRGICVPIAVGLA
jgi:hypothetical protein